MGQSITPINFDEDYDEEYRSNILQKFNLDAVGNLVLESRGKFIIYGIDKSYDVYYSFILWLKQYTMYTGNLCDNLNDNRRISTMEQSEAQ